jgi:hypothetical protein
MVRRVRVCVSLSVVGTRLESIAFHSPEGVSNWTGEVNSCVVNEPSGFSVVFAVGSWRSASAGFASPSPPPCARARGAMPPGAATSRDTRSAQAIAAGRSGRRRPEVEPGALCMAATLSELGRRSGRWLNPGLAIGALPSRATSAQWIRPDPVPSEPVSCEPSYLPMRKSSIRRMTQPSTRKVADRSDRRVRYDLRSLSRPCRRGLLAAREPQTVVG